MATNKRQPDVVVIAVEMDDGSCAVTQMVTREHPQMLDEAGAASPGWEVEPTDDNVRALLDKVFAGRGREWVGYQIIDSAEYHGRDRTFRNAWKLSGGRIDVDMDKARGIWRDALREQRAPLLASLDAAYMKADEVGDAREKARVAAQKQRLRDATQDPRIDAATTPEELKLVQLLAE